MESKSNPSSRRRQSRSRTVKREHLLCERTYDAATLSYTSTTFSIVPTLGSTDGYANLVAVFDQFRIVKATISIVPEISSSDTTTSPTPYLWAVVDNDGAGPATVTEFLQRGCIPQPLNKFRQMTISSPSVLMAGYESAVLSSYTPVVSPWLDTNDYNTPHYGMYFYLDGSPTVGWEAKIFCTLTVEFRNVK